MANVDIGFAAFYLRYMPTDSIRDPYEAADAPLREQEARLVAELDGVRKLRASIAAAREGSASRGLYAPVPAGDAQKISTATSIVAAGKFRGMGLGEACATQLSENRGIELTAKQVWTAISAAGFSILSERPEQAVSWALRKREKKEKDVILVGDGKWGMVEWYSPAQIKKFRDTRNNASGRNHIEHVERTRAGIANAKNTRLDHWGRKRTITGEQMAEAYYAIQGGAKSKLQAAKAAKMAWPTFTYYWCNYEMENWKPGDLFPPARRAVVKKGPDIKLEDMWPSVHTNGHPKNNGPQQLELRPAKSDVH